MSELEKMNKLCSDIRDFAFKVIDKEFQNEDQENKETILYNVLKNSELKQCYVLKKLYNIEMECGE